MLSLRGARRRAVRAEKSSGGGAVSGRVSVARGASCAPSAVGRVSAPLPWAEVVPLLVLCRSPLVLCGCGC